MNIMKWHHTDLSTIIYMKLYSHRNAANNRNMIKHKNAKKIYDDNDDDDAKKKEKRNLY